MKDISNIQELYIVVAMIKLSRSNFLVFNGREKKLEMRNMEPDEFQVIAQIPICLYPR